jgi:hypothetical protein
MVDGTSIIVYLSSLVINLSSNNISLVIYLIPTVATIVLVVSVVDPTVATVPLIVPVVGRSRLHGRSKRRRYHTSKEQQCDQLAQDDETNALF